MKINEYNESDEFYSLGKLVYDDIKNRKINDDDIIRIDAYSSQDFSTFINIKAESTITIIDNTIKVQTENRTEILDLDRFYKVVIW